MVRREEVELTEEVVGRGGWGEVRVAKFRCLRVAAKFLYDVILSDYNYLIRLPQYLYYLIPFSGQLLYLSYQLMLSLHNTNQ